MKHGVATRVLQALLLNHQWHKTNDYHSKVYEETSLFELNEIIIKLLQDEIAITATPLEEIEQYRMQMAGISVAALGYWTEEEGIHPDYDTIALRDVARLYKKYAKLHKQLDDLGLAITNANYIHWTPEMREAYERE